MAGVIDGSWQQMYGARIDDLHLPASQAGRRELMVRYGRDGDYLLEQVHGPGAPERLRKLTAVQALRQIWIQQFCLEVTDGRQEVRRREKLRGGDGLPPGRDELISPYDLDGSYGIKREPLAGADTRSSSPRPATPLERTPVQARTRARHWPDWSGATGRT